MSCSNKINISFREKPAFLVETLLHIMYAYAGKVLVTKFWSRFLPKVSRCNITIHRDYWTVDSNVAAAAEAKV